MRPDKILNDRRSYLWNRFVGIKKKLLPEELTIPESPEEAAKLAFQKGLQTGYGEGLKDGVDLGMDIGLNTEDTGVQSGDEFIS